MLDSSYIEKLTARLTVLEAELSDPGTAANQKKYRALVAEHLNLRHVTTVAERYFRLVREREESKSIADGDDPEMKEMGKAELARVDTELPVAEQELKIALLPPDPDDSRNTIVEIRAGTGGDEAALFAGDLYRMYTRYADRMGWTCGIIDASPSELGGYKEIIFTVEGENVFRTLRYESGGHRVQRVPATEAQGRIHTSAATVAVLPEADEEDEIIIKPDDLRVDLFRSSGAGGQKVNKTESAVRLTHSAHRARGAVPGRAFAAQEPRAGHEGADRQAAGYPARRGSRHAGQRPQDPGGLGRPQRAHPHLQFPAEPRDRPPHQPDPVQPGPRDRGRNGCAGEGAVHE